MEHQEAFEYLKGQYPNLAAILVGTVSGHSSEWPMMARELMTLLNDHRREVKGLIKERDAYKAVLVGEEYENVERLGQQSIELCTVIGQTVATRTKELVQQVTQLTTELDEAKDELVDAEAELRLFRFFDAGKHLGATQRRVVVDSK